MKLKRVLISIIFICVFTMASFARELTMNEKIAIANLKDNIRNKRVESVADQIEFPLNRSSYPEYVIRSAEDFEENFDKIFDKKQVEEFLTSDWYYHYGLLMNDAGYKGHFNDDGVLVIDRIPLSASEWSHVEYLVEKTKETLHPSVKDFAQPVLLMKAGKYLVRIDVLQGGKYRYACWDKGADQSVKPALVLYEGEMFMNRYHASYRFSNNGYEYYIEEGVLGCSFSVSSPTKVLLSLDDYTDNIEFKFYPSYDYSLSRELYMYSVYSDEAIEERGL